MTTCKETTILRRTKSESCWGLPKKIIEMENFKRIVDLCVQCIKNTPQISTFPANVRFQFVNGTQISSVAILYNSIYCVFENSTFLVLFVTFCCRFFFLLSPFYLDLKFLFWIFFFCFHEHRTPLSAASGKPARLHRRQDQLYGGPRAVPALRQRVHQQEGKDPYQRHLI